MSLKGDKYESVEEVKFRLEGSIVTYEERPVYISRVSMPGEGDEKGEIARVFFHELPLNEGKAGEVRKYLTSRKFNLSPFRMGYMNLKDKAVFVSRLPVRQNKQGLTAATTVFTDVFGNKCRDIDFNTMCRSQGFADMVNGKYPSFKECGELLDQKGRESVAISRSFAFSIDHDLEALFLLNKGVRCGMALRGQKALKLPDKFKFLKEELEEYNIPLM
jgi:hypothetical protein